MATRKLGLEYIWIDALCIVQDDANDWAKEAAKMHGVNSNAELTHSSLTSDSVSRPFFLPRSGGPVWPILIKVWLPKGHRVLHSTVDGVACYALFRQWKLRKVSSPKGPVHSRGWTFQEHLFSSRTLYFGAGSLHWECSAGHFYESDPADNISDSFAHHSTYMFDVVKDRTFGRHTASKLERLSEDDRLRAWQQHLADYTKRNLGQASDRLPAFWATSKYFERYQQSEFLGRVLMGSHLLESLFWSCLEPTRDTPTTQSSPSWMWVAVHGTIQFGLASRIPTPHGRLINLAAPIRHDIQVDRVTFRGTGSITLHGTLWSAAAILEHQEYKKHFPSYYSFDFEGHPPIDTCYAFDLVALDDKDHADKKFLLLAAVQPRDRIFQRVGIGTIGQGTARFGGTPLRRIRITKEEGFESYVTLI